MDEIREKIVAWRQRLHEANLKRDNLPAMVNRYRDIALAADRILALLPTEGEPVATIQYGTHPTRGQAWRVWFDIEGCVLRSRWFTDKREAEGVATDINLAFTTPRETDG